MDRCNRCEIILKVMEEVAWTCPPLLPPRRDLASGRGDAAVADGSGCGRRRGCRARTWRRSARPRARALPQPLVADATRALGLAVPAGLAGRSDDAIDIDLACPGAEGMLGIDRASGAFQLPSPALRSITE